MEAWKGWGSVTEKDIRLVGEALILQCCPNPKCNQLIGLNFKINGPSYPLSITSMGWRKLKCDLVCCFCNYWISCFIDLDDGKQPKNGVSNQVGMTGKDYVYSSKDLDGEIWTSRGEKNKFKDLEPISKDDVLDFHAFIKELEGYRND